MPSSNFDPPEMEQLELHHQLDAVAWDSLEDDIWEMLRCMQEQRARRADARLAKAVHERVTGPFLRNVKRLERQGPRVANTQIAHDPLKMFYLPGSQL